VTLTLLLSPALTDLAAEDGQIRQPTHRVSLLLIRSTFVLLSQCSRSAITLLLQ
jgi:hypothetical protein